MNSFLRPLGQRYHRLMTEEEFAFQARPHRQATSVVQPAPKLGRPTFFLPRPTSRRLASFIPMAAGRRFSFFLCCGRASESVYHARTPGYSTYEHHYNC